jgi:ABC-type branched-subunit amino acid transport system ATPase component/branched-subunit amino acid ABC-type transport system permease component
VELVQLTILGLCAGSMLSLSAQGLVLIYRGSGVLNLAHAAIGTLATFVYWDLHDNHQQPFFVALVVALVLSGGVGLVMHLVVIKPLSHASALTKLVATLAVLVIIQSGLELYYGSDQRLAAPVLPTDPVVIDGMRLGKDRLILLGISMLVTVVLYVVYRRTRFGLATVATAENARAAAALGLSPGRIAAINWVAGAGLAGLASVLLAPIIQVQLVAQGALLVSVLAAALMGGLRSFPLTFVGGAVIGISQTLVGRYVSLPGWSDAVPFILIIIVMVVRGTGLSSRPEASEIRPRVGSGRLRASFIVPAAGVLAVLVGWVVAVNWVDAVVLTICVGLILLSSVVVTGYAGQLSLCQFSLAGTGAVIAGLLVSKLHFPFLLGLAGAVLLCFPIGLLVGLPALRARGVNLAVATLGLAAALQSVLFVNPQYTGGDYVSVPSPSFLGIDINSLFFPRRYALFCLGVLIVASLAVANLRRGVAGRRLIAMRSNERAAAALGVNVLGAKLFAFALSASIAAAGGTLLVFRQTNLSFIDQFVPQQSINGVLYSVVGGIGFVLGPIVGSLGEPAGIISTIFHGASDTFALWLSLVLGVLTIRLVQDAPDGFVGLVNTGFSRLTERVRRRRGSNVATKATVVPDPDEENRLSTVVPHTLQIRDLTVGYGGVIALDGFSATVGPGKILGVIGPNGAGKTTLIEAITGFVRPRSGSVLMDGEPIDGWPVHRRVRAGLGRTFQSLELFDDISVLENFRVAADSTRSSLYATDLVWPRQVELPAAAVAAIHEFELVGDLDKLPNELSYGRRRLVAIVRSVAAGPSVLCLDEPAAGLSTIERLELAELMRSLADRMGMAVVLIEHDVDLVMSVCDEIVAVDFGRVIASGPPAVVRRDPAVIAAYLGQDDGDEPEGRPRGLGVDATSTHEAADR